MYNCITENPPIKFQPWTSPSSLRSRRRSWVLSWLEGLKFTVPTNEIFEHSLRFWPGRSDVEAGDVAHGKLLNPQPSAPESSHAGYTSLEAWWGGGALWESNVANVAMENPLKMEVKKRFKWEHHLYHVWFSIATFDYCSVSSSTK